MSACSMDGLMVTWSFRPEYFCSFGKVSVAPASVLVTPPVWAAYSSPHGRTRRFVSELSLCSPAFAATSSLSDSVNGIV